MSERQTHWRARFLKTGEGDVYGPVKKLMDEIAPGSGNAGDLAMHRVGEGWTLRLELVDGRAVEGWGETPVDAAGDFLAVFEEMSQRGERLN